MKIFSLESKTHIALWSIISGVLLFILDTNISFKNFGLVRCNSGYYVTNQNVCPYKGLLDNFLIDNIFAVLLFWLLVAFVLIISTKFFLKNKNNA